MTFQTILAPIDPPPAAVNHVICAVDLARRFDGGLIGVAAEAAPLLAADPTGLSEHDVKASLAAARRERLEAAEREFARVAGSQRFSWRSFATDLTSAVLTQARSADLIVLNALEPGSDASIDIGRALIESGTPVLLVRSGAEYVRARYVIVAWKDTREARRAITDALPFLRAAKEVVLCGISEGNRALEAEALTAVQARLRFHGVNVYSTHVEAGSQPAAELMKCARQATADLVVAGAFGRGRLTELVFGGFTRHLLRQSECSVLFSH